LQICADNENDFTPENRKFLKQCTNAVACVKTAFADVLDSNKGRKT
jgi:hypothetical protein